MPPLVVLLTLTALLLLAIASGTQRWRLPHQPRLQVGVARQRRAHSPRVAASIELAIIAGACLALPFVSIGLTLLLLLAAASLQ